MVYIRDGSVHRIWLGAHALYVGDGSAHTFLRYIKLLSILNILERWLGTRDIYMGGCNFAGIIQCHMCCCWAFLNACSGFVRLGQHVSPCIQLLTALMNV